MQDSVRFNEPMAKYTSWQVGGKADILFMPENIQALVAYLPNLPKDTPVFFCGLGSNILVRDGGIRGLVVATQKFLNKIEKLDEHTLRAEAGVSCASLARFSARADLTGIEFLAGVPGTIGGALAMNAGCHGGETWNAVCAVELIDRKGQISLVPAKEFVTGYRYADIPCDHWFVAGHFALAPGNKDNSLQQIRTLLDYRTHTQPINEPTAGSTFRNPPGDFAARLIEVSGLKSYQIGGAYVSPKHANFIINNGTACAQDIEQLIFYIQAEVKRQQGVELILEVKLVGEKAA